MKLLSICEPRYKNVMKEIQKNSLVDSQSHYSTATLLLGYIEVMGAITRVSPDVVKVMNAAHNINTALELYYIFTTRMN